MKNYWLILEISPGATPDEIKRAFRRLALIHHPDRGGDAEKFKQISEAYQILSGKEMERAPRPTYQQRQHQTTIIYWQGGGFYGGTDTGNNTWRFTF